MIIERLAIPEVMLLKPKKFGDSRGFFSETWNKELLAKEGIDLDFVQDNHSLSVEKGVLRGLHFQSPPHEYVLGVYPELILIRLNRFAA